MTVKNETCSILPMIKDFYSTKRDTPGKTKSELLLILAHKESFLYLNIRKIIDSNGKIIDKVGLESDEGRTSWTESQGWTIPLVSLGVSLQEVLPFIESGLLACNKFEITVPSFESLLLKSLYTGLNSLMMSFKVNGSSIAFNHNEEKIKISCSNDANEIIGFWEPKTCNWTFYDLAQDGYAVDKSTSPADCGWREEYINLIDYLVSSIKSK